jgi:hypothetical protein
MDGSDAAPEFEGIFRNQVHGIAVGQLVFDDKNGWLTVVAFDESRASHLAGID